MTPKERIKQLSREDLAFAIWVAAQCAREVLCLIPEAEERPRLAIEVAEHWILKPGQVDRIALREAAYAAYAVDAAAYTDSAYAAAYAAYAAYAVDAAASAVAAAYAVDAAAYAVDAAAAASAAADYAVGIDTINKVIDYQTSYSNPIHTEIFKANSQVQVAWDYCYHNEPHGSRIEQLCRAHKWGLDWSNNVEKAIAERGKDMDKFFGLLEK